MGKDMTGQDIHYPTQAEIEATIHEGQRMRAAFLRGWFHTVWGWLTHPRMFVRQMHRHA